MVPPVPQSIVPPGLARPTGPLLGVWGQQTQFSLPERLPDLPPSPMGLPDNEQVVAGIALGYADPAAPENALLTGRVPVSEFVSFHP